MEQKNTLNFKRVIEVLTLNILEKFQMKCCLIKVELTHINSTLFKLQNILYIILKYLETFKERGLTSSVDSYINEDRWSR